jgi:Calcineurin-like phosphoesterase
MNSHSSHRPTRSPKRETAPPEGNTESVTTSGPQFAETSPTPDPSKFRVKHGSDKQAYSILDREAGALEPRPFPVLRDTEPVLKLEDAIGGKEGSDVVSAINKAKQLVFHAVGDTGNTRGPKDQSEVADKMVADYDDPDPRSVPSFFYHLGDVVYSFGEDQYYYDQFYDPYRDYPAPIFAIPGNHDGMVSPLSTTPSLQAFIENFCTAGQPVHRPPESGGLVRTAQVQPAIYFTLQAPFVRILGLYSNCLEDPGVISSQGGKYPYLPDSQIDFLKAALTRIKTEPFRGAVIIAVHHPPYVAQISRDEVETQSVGRHGGSSLMWAEIDAVCAEIQVWPHAVLSGHAHNYQRFTRRQADRETPFIVAGNGGHAVVKLTRKGMPTIRVPVVQAALSNGNDSITFESYDDQDFGYLRIVANSLQLRIEYHPASDGADAKTPDDFVTVEIATHKLMHFVAH